ncbi:hypothetical protein F4781DRAFT_374537 [Annulohypoxylon bovei var. microspora]|nr:hypothetical protein F4781DRAFT_374537 [Annulohypoxylon bovei var. microspora]
MPASHSTKILECYAITCLLLALPRPPRSRPFEADERTWVKPLLAGYLRRLMENSTTTFRAGGQKPYDDPPDCNNPLHTRVPDELHDTYLAWPVHPM